MYLIQKCKLRVITSLTYPLTVNPPNNKQNITKVLVLYGHLLNCCILSYWKKYHVVNIWIQIRHYLAPATTHQPLNHVEKGLKLAHIMSEVPNFVLYSHLGRNDSDFKIVFIEFLQSYKNVGTQRAYLL